MINGLESNHYLNWEGNNQFTYVNSHDMGLTVYGAGRDPIYD